MITEAAVTCSGCRNIIDKGEHVFNCDYCDEYNCINCYESGDQTKCCGTNRDEPYY